MRASAWVRAVTLGVTLHFGAWAAAFGQVAVACNAGKVRAASPAAALHPAIVEARYGEIIAARRWMEVLRSVQGDIALTFDSLAANAPTSTYLALEQTFQQALALVLDRLPRLLEAQLSERARLLHAREFLQFEPFQDMNGSWRILQVDSARPMGLVVSDSLKPAEGEAICWAGRSVSRLLGGVNYETVPGALARISELAREWERYRSNGPGQLIHELMLNRLLRPLIAGNGDARFHPARLDLVLVHPFAGVELMRRAGAIRENESMAFETGGFTIWFNHWKQHVGASWVLAYDGDGRIGRGPLVRVNTYATAGVLTRRDESGMRRRSFLLTVDLLRVLKSDAVEQATRQTRAITGKLLDTPLGSRR